MDSNSTVVLIPHCSLQKGERCGVKADQSAMDIYNDNYSGSDHCIADPVFVTSRLRIESQMAAFREHEKEQHPVSSSLQENNLFHDSLIVSGAKPRPRNPWAALGSLAFLTVIVLAAIVIPLLHTDPLPKRETLTMLYLQPPPAAGGNPAKFQGPKPASTNIPTSTGITVPMHKTQEAPLSPVGTTGGVAGGVPGGVFSEMLSSAPSVPVLAKSPVPMPVKRMRIASRVAEANLIHDVPPQYPPEAGRARIEGTVVLMALIGTDGTVKDVRIESGLPILAQAAINAVKQWRYKPYVIDGEPVEVDSRITINFNLSTS